MTHLLIFTLGMIAWQLVCLVVALITKEDADKIAFTSIGFWQLVMLLISVPMYIHKQAKRRKFAAALLDPDGKPCYIMNNNGNVEDLIHNHDFKWNEEIRTKYKVSDGWDKTICLDSKTPNIRYTPIHILKAEGAYKIAYKKIK